MSKQAYIVTCPDDDHGSEVVFASNAKEARQTAYRESCDCGYINQSAKRAPQLDQYAETGVTLKQLIERHGWHSPCSQCELEVWGDEVGVVWARDDQEVFCSSKCYERFVQFWRGHVNCPKWVKEGLCDSVATGRTEEKSD